MQKRSWVASLRVTSLLALSLISTAFATAGCKGQETKAMCNLALRVPGLRVSLDSVMSELPPNSVIVLDDLVRYDNCSNPPTWSWDPIDDSPLTYPKKARPIYAVTPNGLHLEDQELTGITFDLEDLHSQASKLGVVEKYFHPESKIPKDFTMNIKIYRNACSLTAYGSKAHAEADITWTHFPETTCEQEYYNGQGVALPVSAP